MVIIRPGKMQDCTDLLEVYQGTRWFYKVREGGYTTVEQVKDEHRGVLFERWGWLVAEEKGRVIGEIVFRIERTPTTGRVGIIRNLDVDVRNQKMKVGTELTEAAEAVLKDKKAMRVIATTPPAAYNYWMKVKYFARGSLTNLSLSLNKIPDKRTSIIKTVKPAARNKLPTSMKFSYVAYPGSLAELASNVLDSKATGKLIEYHLNDRLIGVGVIVKRDAKNAQFVVDVTKRGLPYIDVVIARTARLASPWKVKTVRTIIPKDQVGVFMSLAKWSSELSTDIPVTKLL